MLIEREAVPVAPEGMENFPCREVPVTTSFDLSMAGSVSR